MNMERAAMRGRLAEEKARQNGLKNKAEGLCSAIRSLLNTAITEVEQIEIAQADQLMDELMATMGEIYTCAGMIHRLDKELN